MSENINKIKRIPKEDAVEQILNLFSRTKNNKEFIQQVSKIRVKYSR